MSKATKAIAWEHTMHQERGQKYRKVTYSAASPFGTRGVDYSAEYHVTRRKLVYAPKESDPK